MHGHRIVRHEFLTAVALHDKISYASKLSLPCLFFDRPCFLNVLSLLKNGVQTIYWSIYARNKKEQKVESEEERRSFSSRLRLRVLISSFNTVKKEAPPQTEKKVKLYRTTNTIAKEPDI